MTPSVASSVVKVALRYCTQNITNGSVLILRMERLPFGAILTTLPSAIGKPYFQLAEIHGWHIIRLDNCLCLFHSL